LPLWRPAIRSAGAFRPPLPTWRAIATPGTGTHPKQNGNFSTHRSGSFAETSHRLIPVRRLIMVYWKGSPISIHPVSPVKAIFALIPMALFSSGAMAQTDVLTQHNDNARTGLNAHETLLTPATVSGGTFRKIGEIPVDGQVYAQPLVYHFEFTRGRFRT